MSLFSTIITKVFPSNTLVYKWAETRNNAEKTVTSLYGGNGVTLKDSAGNVAQAGNDALDAYGYNLLSALNKTSTGISQGAKSTVVSSDIGTFIQNNFIWIIAAIALILIFKPFKR